MSIERLFNVVCRGLFQSSLDYSRTLEALERLAIKVNQEDVDWGIGDEGECTLDSLLVGAYWFCGDYHGGQWSDEYRLQCVIGEFFQPNCSSLGPGSEFDVYTSLEEKHAEFNNSR